jgi:hypothetical protein
MLVKEMPVQKLVLKSEAVAVNLGDKKVLVALVQGLFVHHCGVVVV